MSERVRRDDAAQTLGRDKGPLTMHFVHLPQEECAAWGGDFASLRLATRAAEVMTGRHVLVAINSAARLDVLYRCDDDTRTMTGSIAPPHGNVASTRNVMRLIHSWWPQAVVLWHPALDGIRSLRDWIEPDGQGQQTHQASVDGPSLIRAWQAPRAVSRESDTRAAQVQGISAMMRLLAREKLGIAGDDERPVVSLLANVPSQADAWWFSVVLSILESAGLQVIGASPALALQRGRARRYRHVAGLSTPVIEHDLPYESVLEASDVVITMPRDTDSAVELGDIEGSIAAHGALNQVSTCRALRRGVPTIVTGADSELIPSGLRHLLVADGTRASLVAARAHGLLAEAGLINQVRRVLASQPPINVEDQIIGWVQERISLREIRARVDTLAGSRV